MHQSQALPRLSTRRRRPVGSEDRHCRPGHPQRLWVVAEVAACCTEDPQGVCLVDVVTQLAEDVRCFLEIGDGLVVPVRAQHQFAEAAEYPRSTANLAATAGGG